MKVSIKNASAAIVALTLGVSANLASAEDLLFWSKQGKPVEEAQAMRDKVLSGFDSPVDFQPNDGGPWRFHQLG